MDSNVVPITQHNTPVVDTAPEILVLKFADSRIPVFKESRNKDYIKYGDDNLYPDYLTYLFSKSAKHGAIIGGKAFYIFGEGYENGDVVVNRLGETLNDVAKKAILDIEIYAGFRWEIIWNAVRKVSEIYHVDYTTIRVGKNGGYYFKECWDANNRDEEIFMPAFNPNTPIGSQLYAYNEYRPKTRFYPLPEYIGSNNFIETDIEISKYYLSAIRNGMTPSKMIQFFQGEPTEDKKREIEHRMAKKFAGAENAGKFLLVFNAVNASRSVEVNDLSATDLDKHMIELNKTCQQEIFSGHRVTSPMLFGIKTEGQLGGNTELKASYELFQSTYAKPKANAFDKELNYILSFSSKPAKYELRPTDPIGVQFDVKDVLDKIPLAFIFEKLGIPKEMWPAEAIAPVPQAAPSLDSDIPVNENMKNLSARQLQHVERVVRKYKEGKMTAEMAKTMLRTGLGLTDADINQILGIAAAAMSAHEEEEYVADVFDEYGDSRDDYEVIKSKKVCFRSDIEAEEDETIFIQEAFKTLDVTNTEKAILELLKTDPKATPEVIAAAINQTKKYVTSKLANLVKRGILERASEMIGADEIVSHIVPEAVDVIPPAQTDPPVQIMVKYSYEVKPGIGPAIIETTRPFCRKMIQLNRLYSRAEIEAISLRLGYSVWDRRGGWWGNKPECRHRWVSSIVVKKK
jgi:hypothetical protein